MDVGNRTKPCVFSHKAAPGVDGGNCVCATGAAVTVLLHVAPTVVKCAFKSVNEMIGRAVLMGLVILGCSLQYIMAASC